MTMNPKQLRSRLLRRTSRSTRGAALVEAAVAIPVMLIFMGTTMFAHRSYDMKLAQQASTRSEVLFYASHNCEENAPGEMAQQLGASASSGTGKQTQEADASGGEGGKADQAAGKLRGSEQQGVSRSWNLTKSHRQADVGNSAVEDRKKVYLTRNIKADSEVACNEKRFDNNWTAIFGFIKGFAQSGAGIVD
jgi:hypothetical protein